MELTRGFLIVLGVFLGIKPPLFGTAAAGGSDRERLLEAHLSFSLIIPSQLLAFSL